MDTKVTIPFRDGPRNFEFVLMNARDTHTILYDVIFDYVLPALKDPDTDLLETVAVLGAKLETDEFFTIAGKILRKFKISGHEMEFNDGEYFGGELMALYRCVVEGLKVNFDPFLPDLKSGESLQNVIETMTEKVRNWTEGLIPGASLSGNTPSTK